jgi:HAD superfamily hydrolase (TIGR01509 family)
VSAAEHLPAAVLFDLDGTLVDTEPAWIGGEYAIVERYGGRWSDEHAHAIIGSPLLRAAEYLREHGGVPVPAEEVVEMLVDRVVDHLRAGISWQPGARELLAALRTAGVPCALVTMSYRRIADVVVDALPAGSFAAVVSGDEVTEGKPHPEPYLTAARLLGVDPADCVVIEDSPTGVASGVAAGATVVAVPNLVPIDDGPGRAVLPTLAGVDPGALAAVAAAARDGVAAAPAATRS